MTPEDLIAKMAYGYGATAKIMARSMLRTVLQAIKKGSICRVTNECGEGCCFGVELKPDFEKFLNGGN